MKSNAWLLGLRRWGSGCCLVIGGILAFSGSASARPRVVTTTTLIADWVEQVGQDRIQLTSLLQPGVDPHIYEPVPTNGVALEQAELVFYNGYNLEPSLIRLIYATAQQARRIPLAEEIDPILSDEDGIPTPDPHVWGNVEHVIIMVERIRQELTELAPTEAAFFQANAAAYQAALKELHTWIAEQIQTIPPPNRALVTTHDAFAYYTQTYGLTMGGSLIGLSTEEQPSAQTVAQLVREIRALQVPAIFAETTLNPALIQTVAAEAGVQVAEQELYSDSLGEAGSGAETYLEMMRLNTLAIVNALGGSPN
ncbi:zinc ABC transporter substrate-binding protein [Synechococcus sp. Nb3U1]|uniref:metal ABC transporter solute-binding protein, Zn/Mn family n=1 Tax=Synechococcus sp. Nb3U1 TaxID=1914529 RepID=UPI001F3B59E9|nr:zinc ABC transporter substrate-binding protein [Synechococcus sp. Nb3U1]MCF2969832.1 zinc ABC transporter substrate-binding protein [Synechococcus sp. Nb3U1]